MMRHEMLPNPRAVQNKSLCFASPSHSSSSLGHAGGEALLQAGQKHKTQILCLTTIQVKEKEISLVETGFSAALLRRDGWSQRETSLCIFTDGARILSRTPQLPLRVQISKRSSSPQRFLPRRERLGRVARWRTCRGLSAEPYRLPRSQPARSPVLGSRCPRLLGTAVILGPRTW